MPANDFNHFINPSCFLFGILGGLTPLTSGFIALDWFLLSLQSVSGSGLFGVNLYESCKVASELLILITL